MERRIEVMVCITADVEVRPWDDGDIPDGFEENLVKQSIERLVYDRYSVNGADAKAGCSYDFQVVKRDVHLPYLEIS